MNMLNNRIFQIPEDLSDSDHAEEEDESEQGMDKPNEDNRDEMQKEYDKMNKQVMYYFIFIWVISLSLGNDAK